jgi:hypothetical protein
MQEFQNRQKRRLLIEVMHEQEFPVFTIAEVADSILSYLNIFDLISLHRSSKFFSTCVGSSSSYISQRECFRNGEATDEILDARQDTIKCYKYAGLWLIPPYQNLLQHDKDSRISRLLKKQDVHTVGFNFAYFGYFDMKEYTIALLSAAVRSLFGNKIRPKRPTAKDLTYDGRLTPAYKNVYGRCSNTVDKDTLEYLLAVIWIGLLARHGDKLLSATPPDTVTRIVCIAQEFPYLGYFASKIAEKLTLPTYLHSLYYSDHSWKHIIVELVKRNQWTSHSTSFKNYIVLCLNNGNCDYGFVESHSDTITALLLRYSGVDLQSIYDSMYQVLIHMKNQFVSSRYLDQVLILLDYVSRELIIRDLDLLVGLFSLDVITYLVKHSFVESYLDPRILNEAIENRLDGTIFLTRLIKHHQNTNGSYQHLLQAYEHVATLQHSEWSLKIFRMFIREK